MIKSKNRYFILLQFILPMIACQTSTGYKITTHPGNELHTVEIDSNRIIQECHFMNAEKENNWRHLYVLYFLTDTNEVLPVMYPINQDRHDCMSHLKNVEQILKKDTHVRICVRDKIEKTKGSKATSDIHDFGKLGKYNSIYDGLTFDSICNLRNCVSINDIWHDTCPGFKKSN